MLRAPTWFGRSLVHLGPPSLRQETCPTMAAQQASLLLLMRGQARRCSFAQSLMGWDNAAAIYVHEQAGTALQLCFKNAHVCILQLLLSPSLRVGCDWLLIALILT